MNIVRCKNGHFYDKDKNPAACPLCNSQEESDEYIPVVPPVTPPPVAPPPIIPLSGFVTEKKMADKCISVSQQQMIKPQAVHADIYRNSVILKLRAAAQLKEGENLIYILGDKISSDMRLKFTAHVDSVRILGKVTVTASEKEDSRELEALADESNRLIDKKNILIRQEEQLSDLLNFSALQNVSIEDAMGYLTEIQPKKIQKIHDELHEIQKESELIRKKMKDIEDEKKKERHAAVCVMVNSHTEGEIPFEIIYEESSAGWKPCYEIHMDDETKPLRFRLRAMITRANICEEWKNVSVCLFSETTRQYNEIPRLTPKHLKYMGEKQEKRKVIQAGNSFDGAPMIPSPPPLPSMGYGALHRESTQEMETTGLFDDEFFDEQTYDADMNSDITARFELPGKWTFPEVTSKDQRFREMTIDIQNFTLPGVYDYYAVPAGSTSVYLTAKFEETDVDQILACHADLYVRDIMVGSCMLDAKEAAHRYRLNLGKDDELYAARKQTQNQHHVNKREKTKKDVYEFRITLQNRKSQDVIIQAADQIPISDDSRITVLQEELSGGTYNEETGEVTWSVNVKAKSTTDLILRYCVICK